MYHYIYNKFIILLASYIYILFNLLKIYLFSLLKHNLYFKFIFRYPPEEGLLKTKALRKNICFYIFTKFMFILNKGF